jgi:hypothetical protein
MIGREKEIAKQVILEIILQAGGVLKHKTILFKAFYRAHLRFAQTHTTYLSAWPIVRMPFGPGIHQFDVLLGELLAERAVRFCQIESGPYDGFEFQLAEKNRRQELLPAGAREAIKYAWEQVKDKSASKASEDSHQDSRAWRESRDGEELNIYLDLLDDQQYAAQKQRTHEIAEAFRAVL